MKRGIITSQLAAALTLALLLVAASDAHAQTYVFARGADQTLMYSESNPDGWSPWRSLGGALTSAPDAASWGPDRVDVFATGANKELRQIARVGSAWTPWYDLGGTLASGPSAVSWGPNRIDVVAQGTDRAIWHKAWDGSRWSEWVSLGGRTPAGSAPDIASPGAGKLNVFIRGEDNALWQKAYDNGRWSEWARLGGQITSDPGAVSWGGGRLDVFALGTDNAMYQIAWDGSRWTQWFPQGGQSPAGAAPDAASQRVNQLEVFARGPDNAMWRREWNGSQWSAWRSLGGSFTSDPGAVAVRGAPAPATIAVGGVVGVAGPTGVAPAAATSARFRVKFNGFMVNHIANDDILNRDGWGNEVHLVMPLALVVDREGVILRREGLGVSGPVYGQRDEANREYRAGNSTDTGGLDTGNSFPRARGNERAWTGGGLPAVGLGIPGILFEGQITRGVTAAAVVPTLWEWDPPTDYYAVYEEMLRNPEWPHAISRFLVESPGTGLSGFIRGASQLGIPAMRVNCGENDSPLGMYEAGGSCTFSPMVLILTYESADIMSRTDYGKGPGIIEMRYRDGGDHGDGDYTLYIQIERMP